MAMKFKLRKKIFDRYNGKCQECGSIVRLFARYLGDPTTGEIDHISPRSKGGTDLEENLQLLCLLCNRRKYNIINYGIYKNQKLGKVANL